MSYYATPKRNSGVPVDQCNPPEMVEILLSRLKVCELDESKKSLLCVELNDLLWFFEKHPNSIGMFRADMLEWRTFLKQSKGYMDDMFQTKMARTKKIMDHVMGKPKTIQSKPVKGKPQPSYYQILFRPGIRSVREYPINVEQYGDHNAEIDQLHKQVAKLREEIVYAPQKKISRATKNVFLDMLLSIVEICAYDVLDGVGFLKQMQVLINSIVEGEDYRKRTGIVSYMTSLTSKLKEYAKCHWEQGNVIKRKMWNDIASIERDLELKNNPKFDLQLLTKSDFLKMDKMKEIRRESGSKNEQPQGTTGFREVIKKEQEPSSRPNSSLTGSYYDPSLPVLVPEQKTDDQGATVQDCSSSAHLGNQPKNKGVDHPCSSTSKNIGKSSDKSKQKPSIKKPVKSPVSEWANNIMRKYGEGCHCGGDLDENKICRNKGVKYIPDADFEEETIFKSKENPKTNYGLLRHVTIPPPIDATDANTPLIDLIRVELEGGGEDRASPDLPSDINPILGRKRLLEY